MMCLMLAVSCVDVVTLVGVCNQLIAASRMFTFTLWSSAFLVISAMGCEITM